MGLIDEQLTGIVFTDGKHSIEGLASNVVDTERGTKRNELLGDVRDQRNPPFARGCFLGHANGDGHVEPPVIVVRFGTAPDRLPAALFP